MILKVEFTISVPDRYAEAMKVSTEYKTVTEVAQRAAFNHVDTVLFVYDTLNKEKSDVSSQEESAQ